MTKATLRGGPGAGKKRGVCAGGRGGGDIRVPDLRVSPQLLGRTRPESSLWLVLCAALQLGAHVGYQRLVALCVSGQLGVMWGDAPGWCKKCGEALHLGRGVSSSSSS